MDVIEVVDELVSEMAIYVTLLDKSIIDFVYEKNGSDLEIILEPDLQRDIIPSKDSVLSKRVVLY